jgi:hypothetical protein
MAAERIDDSKLTAALATPEEGVSRPGRVHPTSAITQIAALKPGESWSRCERPMGDVTLAEYADGSADMRDQMRNSILSSVRYAKEKTGGTYITETGDFISSNRRIFLVCVVTRVE